MWSLTLHIEGMSCGHCLNAVNLALANQAGITVGTVKMGRADLQYDPAVIGPAGRRPGTAGPRGGSAR